MSRQMQHHRLEQNDGKAELYHILTQLDILHGAVKQAELTLFGKFANHTDPTKQALAYFAGNWEQNKSWIQSCMTHAEFKDCAKIVDLLDTFHAAITETETSLNKSHKNNKRVQSIGAQFIQQWPVCSRKLASFITAQSYQKHHLDQNPIKSGSYPKQDTRAEEFRDGAVNKAGLNLGAAAYLSFSAEQKRAFTSSVPANFDANAVKERTQIELERERNALQAERDSLKKEVTTLRQKNDELLQTMSAMMNNKMSTDERNFENINDPHRPTVVCDEFAMFCSNQWLNAKSQLDKIGFRGEDERCKLLCDILVEASLLARNEAVQVYKSVRSILVSVQNETLIVPQKAQQKRNDEVKSSEGGDLPEDMHVAISKYLKRGIETKSLERMKHNVKENIGRKMKIEKKVLEQPSVQKYMEDAVEIAWKMAVQLPMMSMMIDEVKYDPTKHELALTSVDPQRGGRISYYVHPMVLHKKQIVRKGKVLLR